MTPWWVYAVGAIGTLGNLAVSLLSYRNSSRARRTAHDARTIATKEKLTRERMDRRLDQRRVRPPGE